MCGLQKQEPAANYPHQIIKITVYLTKLPFRICQFSLSKWFVGYFVILKYYINEHSLNNTHAS